MEDEYIQLVDQFYETPTEQLFQQIKDWHKIQLFSKNNSNVSDKFRKVAQTHFIRDFTNSLGSETDVKDLTTISRIIKQPISELQDYLNVFVEKLNKVNSEEQHIDAYPIEQIQNRLVREAPDGNKFVYLLPVDFENLLNQLENKIYKIAYIDDPGNH